MIFNQIDNKKLPERNWNRVFNNGPFWVPFPDLNHFREVIYQKEI